ncbi:Dbl homology domain-containing protein [Lentinula edodes]|uniref:Dbl homology domain-containing protein n=1 Tax=Lentinula edodes TaxID=5353 RepID=A0A1Q3DVN9_LENED|nr:Dbl homology domain-containing protein [Lentinula edodes]
MDPEINRHKFKDDIRRYHALMELLSTEVSYMQDLRILVSIYLRQIPTLTLKRSSSTSSTFGLNSSFSALSRANSSVHLSNITGHSSYIQPLTNAPSKEREKSPSRRIFKNPEIDVLTRNADEVLQFHEHFVEELRTAMAPLGIHMESSSEHSSDDEISVGNVETIDAGIAIVSTKFATEASRFTSYELFCAGHLEAIDVIRRVQNAHPTDWEAFEQKCSASAFEMLKSSDAVPVSISQLASTSQSRRNSTATIDDAVRYVRSRSNSLVKDKDTSTPRNRSRLTFMDYLIKPVQRICKYPLLLEQLKSSEPLYESKIRVPWLSGRNVVVESAAQAMRHVASTVDEARQRQDVAVRSALIASRILYSHVLQSPSPSPLQVLTPGFLSSLGPCHIAGSLDVIHQRSIKQSTGTANINVKYLGRTYEPRHWFRLGDFKIIEAVESEAWLPCSFRLSCKGHEFEFAAACQQEREAWLTAIRESLAYPTSSWINEPTASILLDGKGEIVPSMLDDPYEAIVPLPTINSVPELASDTGDQLTETLLDALATESQMLQATATSSPEVPSIPSRRSSSTSAQAFSTPTSPEYETFVIRQLFESPRSEFKAELSIINKF